MLVSMRDMPKWVQENVEKCLDQKLKEIEIEYAEVIKIGIVWHEACRRYLFARRPQDGKIMQLDSGYYDSLLNSEREQRMAYFGGEIKLPPGGEILEVLTYPKMAKLYRHPSLGGTGLPEKYELSEEEKLVLYIHRTYIPSARPEYFRRAGLKKDQVENIIRSLQDKGYMQKNKALTLKGKNAVGSLDRETIRELERRISLIQY